MAAFPPIGHVALTVRDLSVSVPWYEALFEAKPALDEDTEPDFHHTVYLSGSNMLFGLHQHETPAPDGAFQNSAWAWTMSRSHARTVGSSRSGRVAWMSSGSSTARSRWRHTGPVSASGTPTASRWNSSRRRAEPHERRSDELARSGRGRLHPGPAPIVGDRARSDPHQIRAGNEEPCEGQQRRSLDEQVADRGTAEQQSERQHA